MDRALTVEKPTPVPFMPEVENKPTPDYAKIFESFFGAGYDQTPPTFQVENLTDAWRAASEGYDRHNHLPLYNNKTRRLLGIEAAQAILSGGHFAVFIADIDNLKKANDEYDREQFGDRLIKRDTANLLQRVEKLALTGKVFALRPSGAADEIYLVFIGLSDEDEQKLGALTAEVNSDKPELAELPDKNGGNRPYRFSTTAAYLSTRDLDKGPVSRDQVDAQNEYLRDRQLYLTAREQGLPAELIPLRKILSLMLSSVDKSVHRLKGLEEQAGYPISDEKLADLSLEDMAAILTAEYGGGRISDSTIARIVKQAFALGQKYKGV